MAKPERPAFFLEPPDTDVLRRSKKLATAARWRVLGGNSHLVWGECRSRGASYFKTALSLHKKTTYCSCPSRKTPCVHALALAQLLNRDSHLFHQPGQPPAWVQERLSTGRAGTGSAVDRARARSHQQDKRLAAMQSGMNQLVEWLKDLLRHGLAAAYDQPDSFWEDMAAQLVDAKLGALGKRVRSVPQLLQQAGWPELLLEEVGEWYLLARAFEKREALPEPLQADVLGLCGVQWKKAEILRQQAAPPEPWQVMSTSHSSEDQLQVRRTWLLGRRSDRFALLLDFAWGQASLEGNWKPGDWLLGGLVYYPGSYPQRALLKGLEDQQPADAFSLQNPPCHTDWSSLLDRFARAVSEQPFLAGIPALVKPRTIARQHDQWHLIDDRAQALPLMAPDAQIWPVVAQAALDPVPVFGEWDGRYFRPLSLVISGRAVGFPT